MKVILATHGTVGIRVSGDDVAPRPGTLIREIIDFVGETYRFHVKPTISPGVAPFMVPNYVFQSGQLVSGENKLPIAQLAIIPNGDFVTANDTDVADKIMDDFMARLDATFGYRFAAAQKQRVYQSNVVVEFEPPLSEKIDAFKKIELILNGASIRSAPFNFKRLAFGIGDIQRIATMSTIDEVENSDFIIERRAGEPYSRNRSFAARP